MAPLDSGDTERWAAAAAWSRRTHLDPVETVLWRAERHPVQSATTCLLIDLDREPDWERFVSATDWGVHLVRRLRQRVLDPALPTAPPVWVDDPHFSLTYHVRRRTLGGDGTRADLLDAAAQFALRPFDRTRPLWEGVLFTGLEGGGAAYVLKIHHTLADGLGTVELLSLLQSRTRRHTSDKPTAPTPSAGLSPDSRSLATDGMVRDLVLMPERATAVARSLVSAAFSPRTATAQAMRYAASARRLVATPPAAPSPLMAARSGHEWHLLTLSAEREAMRAAGRGVGGSLQDVFVAVLAGGLGRYHELHGEPVEELPVAIRVSLDRADDPMSGNRFAGAMIAAPVGLEDAGDRIAAVRGEVLSLHTETALGAFRALAPLAARLPSDVVSGLLQLGSAADASVATIPGPTKAAFMAGAQVTGMYPFAPLPGVAIAATLLTLGDTVCLGFNVDAEAVPDLDVLEECLQRSLDEVLAAG